MAPSLYLTSKALIPTPRPSLFPPSFQPSFSSLRFNAETQPLTRSVPSKLRVRAVNDSDYSSRRSSSNEQRETIMLPGCDYNHWLIVMEFPKDPAPTREQMIETYLNTLATVLGRCFFTNLCFKLCSLTVYVCFNRKCFWVLFVLGQILLLWRNFW